MFAILLPFALFANAQATLNLDDHNAVLAAAKAAMGPLQQYFNGPNVEGKGAWTEQKGNRWVVQWHESGMYQDIFYQYALASGDESNNAFVTGNMIACDEENGNFLGGLNPNLPEDTRWNDDISWWALSSESGAEATGETTLANLASTTFDEVWKYWDDQCGGGIFWSRDQAPGTTAPYLKSTITNVQMMDLGARLGHLDKVNQIWSWLKSSGLVVDDGHGGYVVFDNIMTDGCKLSNEVFSYEYGEAITALSVMGQVDEAIKVFNGLKRIFVASDGILGPQHCKKDPCGYSWPVYKGFSYLWKATSDTPTKNAITSIMKSTASVVLDHCTSEWDCMRDFAPGTQFTLLEPNGKNVRDQFEAGYFLNAMIHISADGNGSWFAADGSSEPSSSSAVASSVATELTSATEATVAPSSAISSFISTSNTTLSSSVTISMTQPPSVTSSSDTPTTSTLSTISFTRSIVAPTDSAALSYSHTAAFAAVVTLFWI
ncbi:hydrolase 76 protein [Podochytrium sp. JEL0797]|nr:hydrolase 76 protein [Podochytrium sp. JEL0797]